MLELLVAILAYLLLRAIFAAFRAVIRAARSGCEFVGWISVAVFLAIRLHRQKAGARRLHGMQYFLPEEE